MPQYRLYHNLSSHYARGWETGDKLADGYAGTLPDIDPQGVDVQSVDSCLWNIYLTHNDDDRPDGQTAPSLSIGDVIVLGETAFTIDFEGTWHRINLTADDLMGVDYRTARELVWG